MNKAPISDLKEMENDELSDKVFRIILLKKFSELKQNTDFFFKLNEMRKIIHKQNERCNREIKTIEITPNRSSLLHSSVPSLYSLTLGLLIGVISMVLISNCIYLVPFSFFLKSLAEG